MSRWRRFHGSLRLRMTLLLLVGMSGATYLGLLVSQYEPADGRTRHLPDYALIVLVASSISAVLAARLATRPLSRLVDAAESFADSLDPRPLPETGPSELRAAIATFNLMQRRVSEGLADRLHMLSAVNHDLRTPLTRISLRLQQIDDPDLRQRLRSDVAVIEAMVARGLEFVRSGTAREPLEVVDLDALLQTVGDEAAELGGVVRYEAFAGLVIQTAPETLSRCLSNLVDNAVRHADGAELGCGVVGDWIVITIADRGPGISAIRGHNMFEPFAHSPDPGSPSAGYGLGLAIAQRQARSIGGDVRLAERPGGGLVVQVRLPLVRPG